MPAMGLGETSNCANPKLDIYTKLGGAFVDVSSLEFEIYEKVTTPTVPIKVFPPSGRAAPDITNDCPTGERLSAGHYVGTYTVPVTALTGTYEVRWYFKLTPSTPEQTFREEFEVLPVAGAIDGLYSTILKMREEGVPATISDERIVMAISMASAYIDKYTGRFFNPRNKTFMLDGTGTPRLLLEQPIISLTQLLLGPDLGPDSAVDLSSLQVYNRHITANLLHPDDRENPKIELGTNFPRGHQNIQLDGIFGYTDPDGSPSGSTPLAITYACNLIANEMLPKVFSTDVTDSVQMSSGLIELRTRDQWVRFAEPNKRGAQAPGPFFGDRRIDNVLMSYRRPPLLRSV